MRRREFIALLGGAAATRPLAARAQQPERVRRIGVLLGRAATDPGGRQQAQAFEQALLQLGWAGEQNVRIDYRWAAGDTDRMRDLAKELVDAGPDVLVGQATPVVAALQRETRTVPIVFLAVTDPVESGFVESLPKPGGNITGFVDLEPSLGGKWVELLKQVAPRLVRVTCISNPDTAPGGGKYYLGSLKAAGASLSVETIVASVHDAAEIEGAITAIAREQNGGLIVMPEIFNAIHRSLIVSLAARHRVPAIYTIRFFTASGGLMSYGADLTDLYRRAASYVDRILRGARPTELPVELPTKFELVINLKTAKALGLDIPPMLLARADEVIE